MKKLYSFILLLFICSTSLKAQTQRGNIIVGADIANIGGVFQSGNTIFDFGLTPMVGFFFQDNVAVGPVLNFNYTHTDDGNFFTWGVGAFGRKYFEDASIDFSKYSSWFLEANAGIQGVNSDGSNTNGLGLGFGPGLSYFITPNIGLEGLLKYNLTLGFGSSTTSNAVGLNIGLQIYLNKNVPKQAIEREKSN